MIRGPLALDNSHIRGRQHPANCKASGLHVRPAGAGREVEAMDVVSCSGEPWCAAPPRILRVVLAAMDYGHLQQGPYSVLVWRPVVVVCWGAGLYRARGEV